MITKLSSPPFRVNATADLSTTLLEKNQLLTPGLKKHFGQICAFESDRLECMETATTYLRESILKQSCTGKKILDATLRVLKNHFPKEMIVDLRSTLTPFGDLLKKYGIAVDIKERQTLQNTDVYTGITRMGRSHIMLKRGTNDIVCYVRELLVCEQELLCAKNEFLHLKKNMYL